MGRGRAGVLAVTPVIKVAVIALSSAALVGAAPGAIPTTTYSVPLDGRQQMNFAYPAGGTGDIDGSGHVTLTVAPAKRRVCFDFRLSGLSEPVMAHIHRGAPLRNGPPVIILFTGANSGLQDCVASTRSQLSEIVANPSNFYVAVDTGEYPDGALRGQL